MSILTGRAVLNLYKSLLRAATQYPTIKRRSIIEEIRKGFRESRNETDKDKLVALFDESHRALKELSRYNKVVKDPSNNWSVNLW